MKAFRRDIIDFNYKGKTILGKVIGIEVESKSTNYRVITKTGEVININEKDIIKIYQRKG
jgi:hypothetical protein